VIAVFHGCSLAYLFRMHATDTSGPSQPVVTEEA
jgi:hypothetical protein